MSDKIINYLLNNYLNIYYSYNKEIEIEINNLIDNGECSIKNEITSYYSIEGVSNIFFIKIIPNLFRQCYINSSLKIPNICPSIVKNGISTLYLPKLINEKYIKSFLYFNFPASSGIYYTLEDLTKNTILVNKLFRTKKINETYGSKTSATVLFSEIYSNNSMLINLLKFNKFLNNSNTFINLNLVGTNFTVEWDCTLSCFCNNENNTYVVGNVNDNIIINYNDASTIYNLYNNAINQNILNTINVDIINYNINIFLVLKYAVEVYSDILCQIDYFLASKIYCLQDYMNPSNIPILFSLYNNFYNNQIMTNNLELENSTINKVVPDTITIENYVNSFITVYLKSYPSNYLLKTVYIDNIIALVFFGTTNNPSTITNNDYIYYFINVNNPSPILLINNNPFSAYYDSVILYVNDFLIYYINYLGGAEAVEKKIYNNGGLYPNLGTNKDDIQNIGYLYFFYKDDILIAVAYLSLETDSNGNPLGYGLALDYSDYNVII